MFDLAAGKNVAQPPLRIQEPGTPKVPRTKPKYKKGSPHEETTNTMLVSEDILAGRMEIPDAHTPFPSWSRLGAGIFKKSCSTWERGVDGDDCKACRKSPLVHRLLPHDDRKGFQVSAFCALRNIRCAAFVSATTEGLDNLLPVIRQDALAIARLPMPRMGSGEAELLGEKVNDLVKLSGGKSSSKSQWIRLIMACDALYLRLYYLQISGAIKNENSDHLPHPTDFFGIPYLTMASDSESSFAEVCGEARLDEEVAIRFGLESTMKSRHPLAFLHRQRLIETHSLFKSSELSEEFQVKLNEPMKHKVSTLEYHDTPAPSILAEWRDSCRDMLCNLYGYATLSGESLAELKTALQTYNIQSVVELGAGTGYLAKVLVDHHGIAVDAFDIAPPALSAKEMNEYHGQTAPFYLVQEGNVDILARRPDVNEAFLLCYPPPQMEFAHDALDIYSGKCFVFVGEFAGLTGSASFENLLKKDFECILRRPCLTWGTDASSLTVWMKAETPLSSPSLLLPCSKCGEREATRRCKLARHVVYCSETCFRGHKQTLNQYFLLGMIAVDSGALDFASPNHFLPLPSRLATPILKSGDKRRIDNSAPRFLSNQMKRKKESRQYLL